MPARYWHFKTPGNVQPGADQSMTRESGEGDGKTCMPRGWRAMAKEMVVSSSGGGGWYRQRMDLLERVMDEATNCDEIARQRLDEVHGERERNRREEPSKPRDDTRRPIGCPDYDWFVDADWSSRGLPISKARNWAAVPTKRARLAERRAGRNGRWETVPPAIGHSPL